MAWSVTAKGVMLADLSFWSCWSQLEVKGALHPVLTEVEEVCPC